MDKTTRAVVASHKRIMKLTARIVKKLDIGASHMSGTRWADRMAFVQTQVSDLQALLDAEYGKFTR